MPGLRLRAAGRFLLQGSCLPILRDAAHGDGADHLVVTSCPPVPLRQWVLSLPRRVRFLAARRPALASRLLDVFTRAVF
jgi:hypothetical protein